MLSREFQRELLSGLAGIYPHKSNQRFNSKDDLPALANVAYLVEHGLITASITPYADGSIDAQLPKITAKGLDFILDDGGLSAVLGVLNVRLDATSMRALIEAKVTDEDAPPEVKADIIAALRQAPSEAIGEVCRTLASAGIQAIPSLIQLLQKSLGP